MSNLPDRVLPLPHKLGLLATLYLAQGVPIGFFTQALPVVMRQEGYALAWIGLSSLLGLPWGLKWLWAPVIDARYSRRLGRRRTWLLGLQVTAALLLLTLALTGHEGAIVWLLVGSVVSNLLAASQDVATDGLAVELLTVKERAAGNGVQVAAYRLGMIFGGGALLVVFDRLGWSAALAAMAGVSLVTLVPVLLYREPESLAPPSRPESPFGLLKQPTLGLWCALLFLYKLGDALAAGMIRPYLVDTRLSVSAIGTLVGATGSAAGLVGALLGGLLTGRLGSRRALLVFGVLNACALSGYAWLAWGWLGREWLVVTLAAEHLAGGMATVALFTCMMQWCRKGHEGSDYTLQASLVVVSTGLAHALSGFSAHAWGYGAHFTLAALGTFLAAVISYWLFPYLRTPSEACASGA